MGQTVIKVGTTAVNQTSINRTQLRKRAKANVIVMLKKLTRCRILICLLTEKLATITIKGTKGTSHKWRRINKNLQILQRAQALVRHMKKKFLLGRASASNRRRVWTHMLKASSNNNQLSVGLRRNLIAQLAWIIFKICLFGRLFQWTWSKVISNTILIWHLMILRLNFEHEWKVYFSKMIEILYQKIS